MYRNLIWDAGGTLFDTYPATTTAFMRALAEHGIRAPEERVRALALVSQQHAAQTLAGEYRLDLEPFWARFRELLKEAPPELQMPFPGVRAVLTAVHARGGVNLIATHRACELVDALLAAHALADFFAEILSTSDGYPRKPDPAMLNLLVEHHRLQRAETLAVGDREIDLAAARAAGLPFALFRGPDGLEPDLALQDYAELLPLIG